jgi:hypothetical protein
MGTPLTRYHVSVEGEWIEAETPEEAARQFGPLDELDMGTAVVVTHSDHVVVLQKDLIRCEAIHR